MFFLFGDSFALRLGNSFCGQFVQWLLVAEICVQEAIFHVHDYFRASRACVPKNPNQLDHKAKTKLPAAGQTNMRQVYHNREGSAE